MNERENTNDSSIGIPRECSIETLFEGKVFVIPKYQRSYSWEEKQIEDFWNDIKDGFNTNTIHYWGQVTIQRTAKRAETNEGQRFTKCKIVDGQQRITTLTLFMYALSKILVEDIGDEKGENLSKIIKTNFVKTSNVFRLRLGELNNDFFKIVINSEDIIDSDFETIINNENITNEDMDLRTNELIYNTLDCFLQHIKNYLEGRSNKYEILNDIFEYVQSNTLSLEYNISKDAPAPRIFLIINDRGKDPTLLDKTKSLLIFWSFRYFNGDLDNSISKSFGEIFKDYDHIKDTGEEAKIEYIARYDHRGLNENTLLTFFYHYFGKYAIKEYEITDLRYDYNYTPEKVFNVFLKKSLEYLSSYNNKNGKLKSFIKEMVKEFEEYTSKFRNLLEETEMNIKYKKLFSFLGPNPLVYPLIVNLYKEDILDDEILKLIETLDLRVYKIRGTDPRADLYRKLISSIKLKSKNNQLSKEFILNNLRNFISWFMSDSELQRRLSGEVYGKGVDWLRYVLWEYNKKQFPNKIDDSNLDMYKPEDRDNSLEIEHIFPGNVPDDFPFAGFDNIDEYSSFINHFGNLLLLERYLNRKARDKGLSEKTSFYNKSKMPETDNLGFFIYEQGFDIDKLNERTKKIINFCLGRWKLD